MPLLVAETVRKSFGRTIALSQGDLTVERGEVHVLIGSNGCGKSTLCKVVAGAVAPDSGRIVFDGREGAFPDPKSAAEAGIAVFYQELSLIPDLTVTENIALGQETLRRGLVDDTAARSRAEAILRRFGKTGGVGLTLDAPVANLTADQRQIVEIAKILAREPKLVIFDEATSSLDAEQVAVFFDIVRGLKADGLGIIFISHRMDEVFEIGDRVTVMRDGVSVATLPLAETDRGAVLNLMVGGQLAERQGGAKAARQAGETVLDVRGLTGSRLQGVDLTVRRGEIVGLGGLHGQGQSALLQALFAARPARGDVSLDGRPLRVRRPVEAIRAGIAYISGDRGRTGVMLERTILENMAIARLAGRRAGFLSPARFIAFVGDMVARLKLRFSGYFAPVKTLSGGNQQKVVIARWLATEPRLLLLDDPTKGIDVEAKADLYAMMDDLCAQGVGILLYSSEDEELLTAADRVLVFHSGRVTRELAGADLNAHALYEAAYEMTRAA